MAITITLDDIQIYEWTVNLLKENVIVEYGILSSDDVVITRARAIFYRNIPPTYDPSGNPVPPPSNWYQLPESYALQLIDLNDAVRTALINDLL